METNTEIFNFFVGRERKGQAVFSACAFARLRGCSAKLERKYSTRGPAKRVQSGRIAVEGLYDFLRGLGMHG